MTSKTKWITGVVSALAVGGISAGIAIPMVMNNRDKYTPPVVEFPPAVNSLMEGIEAIYNEEQKSFGDYLREDDGVTTKGDLAVEISSDLQESWGLGENFTEEGENWGKSHREKVYKVNSNIFGTLRWDNEMSGESYYNDEANYHTGNTIGIWDNNFQGINDLFYNKGSVNSEKFSEEDEDIRIGWTFEETGKSVSLSAWNRSLNGDSLIGYSYSYENEYEEKNISESEWTTLLNDFNTVIDGVKTPILENINKVVNGTEYEYSNQT